MNAHAVKPKVARSHRLRWMLGACAIPIVLVICCFVVLGVREWRARQSVLDEIEQLRQAGQPVDDASMAAWFLAHTSQAGTAAWGEILRLVSSDWVSDMAAYLPCVGTKKLPVAIEPGGAWPEEAAVGQFLAEMKPVVEWIHQACELPAPVWQPLHFSGNTTLLPELQESRTIMRLLQLEVEDACFHRQPERAMKAMSSMQGVARAFDWRLCLVSELIYQNHVAAHQLTLCRALTCDIWRAEHIAEMMRQVENPDDVAEHWRQPMSGERGMVLSDMAGTGERLAAYGEQPAMSWLLLTPSAQQYYLSFTRDVAQIATSSIADLRRGAAVLEEQTKLDRRSGSSVIPNRLLAQIAVPALQASAKVFENSEHMRRLTLTALGVKRFRLERDRWPKELSELAQVGLKPTDWTALEHGPFGYQVDGERAIVWGYDSNQGTAVSPTPPAIQSIDDAEKYWYVVTIR